MSNTPMYGCSGCATTTGLMGCPTHGHLAPVRTLNNPVVQVDLRCPGWTVTAEEVAKSFHRIYEHLAPAFGYETRPETAVEWDDLPENNRRLMTETVQHVLQQWFPAHVGNWLDQGGNWRTHSDDHHQAPDGEQFDSQGETS